MGGRRLGWVAALAIRNTHLHLAYDLTTGALEPAPDPSIWPDMAVTGLDIPYGGVCRW